MEHSDLFYEKLEWNCVLDSMCGDDAEEHDEVYGDWPEDDW